MNYRVEFDRIERSWQPNWLITFLESNPITNLFWRVIKTICGYDDSYRVANWDDDVTIILSYSNEIPPDHCDYPRYYNICRRIAPYNPFLRERFRYMSAPQSNPIFVSPLAPRTPTAPVPIGHNNRGNVITQLPVTGSPHARVSPLANMAGRVPPPTEGFQVINSAVPLSQQNFVPPPTTGFAVGPTRGQVPLSQQNFVPAPTSGFAVGPTSRVPEPAVVPLSRQNQAPLPTHGGLGEQRGVPLSRQNQVPLPTQGGHGDLRGVPLSRQNDEHKR